MPVYEYKCEVCGKELEVEHKISDSVEVQCNCSFGYVIGDMQFCGYPKMKKQISLTSFSLKGGTWAKDNYSRRGKK